MISRSSLPDLFKYLSSFFSPYSGTMDDILAIVILLFGYLLFQFGIHFSFGAQFSLWFLVSFLSFSSLSRIARLSSTFFEIGYYGVTISIFVIWLYLFFSRTFIHSSLLLLVSFFCGWFLYIRFHVSSRYFSPISLQITSSSLFSLPF